MMTVFCGVGDYDVRKARRVRRYVVNEAGSKWQGENITYKIENYTKKLGPDKTRRAILTAIRHWKRYLPIPLVEQMVRILVSKCLLLFI